MNDSRTTRMTKNPSATVMFPENHLALISLAVGFLVIWTSVIAGVLVSNTVSDNVAAKETVKIFGVHEKLAKLTFSLGHELVSNVDWLLTSTQRTDKQMSIKESVGITWKMTDNMIADIREDALRKDNENLLNLLTLVQIKLDRFRASALYPQQSPMIVIQFYLDLSEFIERRCFMLDAQSLSITIRRHVPAPSTSFALFIKGMSKRFAELAFGTVYVRSDLPLNKSQYMHLHYSSRELIENAFQLNPRAQLRYWELQEQDPKGSQVLLSLCEDMLAGSLNRGDAHFASLYLNTVKKEIAMLLRAKDFLYTSLSTQIEQLAGTRHKVLAFHLSIAIIAITSVVLCLALLCCSFRYVGSKSNQFNDNKFNCCKDEIRESVYNVDYNDKSQMLEPHFYNKQFY